MNKLLKSTVIYSLGEALPRAINIFLLPIYTKYLLPTEYGILAYTNTISIFLFSVSSFGLQTYLLRFFFEKKNKIEREKLVGSVFLFVGLINIFFSLIMFFLLPSILNFEGVEFSEQYIQFAIIITFFEVFSIVPQIIFRVNKKPIKFILLSVFRVVLQASLTIYFLTILNKSLFSVYYGRLLGVLPFFFTYIIIVYSNSKFKFNFSEIKTGLIFSFPVLLTSLAYLILNYSDRFILERFVSLSELGFYNLAFTIAFSITILIQGFYRSIEPEIYQKYGQENFYNFILIVKNNYYFFLFSISSFLILFSKEIISFIAATNYHESFLYVPGLVLSITIYGQNLFFMTILTAEKKIKLILKATLIGAGYNIIANFIFIRYFGVWGAVINSVIAYLIMNIILSQELNIKNKEPMFKIISLMPIAIIVIFITYFNNAIAGIFIEHIFLKLVAFTLSLFFYFYLYEIKTKTFFS